MLSPLVPDVSAGSGVCASAACEANVPIRNAAAMNAFFKRYPPVDTGMLRFEANPLMAENECCAG